MAVVLAIQRRPPRRTDGGEVKSAMLQKRADIQESPVATPLNIERLLAPISDECPSGEDLRYAEIYDLIKEARRADDQLEQGEWRTDFKTSDWRHADKLCSRVLVEESKDLQVAVWLVEAWMHLHGFAGFGAGLDLICRLLKDFWPSLHPQMEDGDIEYRVGPLTLLNEKLPSVVFQIPLCDPEHSRGYGYYQWTEAQQVGSGQNLDKEQKKRREAMIEEGKTTAEAFTAATNASPLSYYREMTKHLSRSRQSLERLDGEVTELFAPDPPCFNQLMEAMDTCSHVVDRIFKDKRKSEVLPEEEVEEAMPIKQTEVDTDQRQETPGGEQQEAMTIRLPETQARAIGDISAEESGLWQQASNKLGQGRLKAAMDQLLSAGALAPSVREKYRYLLLLAKLCLKANRADLARPIAEEIHTAIETLNLEKWEHPSWIAEVVETLYRCLLAANESDGKRAVALFQKLCLLNVTKAAAYRLS